MCIRHDHSLPGVKRQGRRSRSTVTRSVRPQSGADIFPVVCTFTSCSAGQNSGHSSLELPLVLTVIATCVAMQRALIVNSRPVRFHCIRRALHRTNVVGQLAVAQRSEVDLIHFQRQRHRLSMGKYATNTCDRATFWAREPTVTR